MDAYVCKQDRQHAAATPPPHPFEGHCPQSLRLHVLFGNRNAWGKLLSLAGKGDEEAVKCLEEINVALRSVGMEKLFFN